MSDLSPEEHAHLDQLWNCTSYTISEIKQKMQSKFCVKYTQEQLRDAARRNDKLAEAGPRPVISVEALTPRIVWKTPVGSKCANPVKPGSFPVPLGGYKILGRNF